MVCVWDEEDGKTEDIHPHSGSIFGIPPPNNQIREEINAQITVMEREQALRATRGSKKRKLTSGWMKIRWLYVGGRLCPEALGVQRGEGEIYRSWVSRGLL